MPKPSIQRLIELQQLLLQFQAVERFVRNPLDNSHKENDVEHSYHLAMAAWFLAPHFGLDADRAIRLALAHDMIEIHAGDTFVYGMQEHLDSKDKREHDALEQLRREWPDFAQMTASIQEYKEKSSEEAKFVYALDKLMPAILNKLNGGLTLREHRVTVEIYKAEKERKIPKDSPLFPYHLELLELLRQIPGTFHEADKHTPETSQQR